jgi:selenide,water dikinase
VLTQVLGGFQFAKTDDHIVGPETLDDAGVYRLADDLAIVQTVDFIPPVTDDPRMFGRIAAANAFSDIYAMGGKPVTALNLVGFPSDSLDLDILGETLKGGNEIVAEAGASVLGGHSVKDEEFKYGLAVTGVIHPDQAVANRGGHVGDVMILTKPIGMGVVTTAYRQRKIDDAEALGAFEQMATLNKTACEVMMRVGASACTDVTGFGLLGHGHELASASGVTMRLRARDVPLFGLSLELARRKMLTRGCKQSRGYLGEQAEVLADVEKPLADLCFDAETSGGLLMAVPAEKADEMLRELHAAGVGAAAKVGELVAKTSRTVVLAP